MTLSLYRYDEAPAGGWRYKDPETGRWIDAVTWSDLRKAVRKHKMANNLPIPMGLDRAIEQQLCEIIPPEYCHGDGPHVSAAAHAPTLREAIEGTAVILDWWRQGKERVNPLEAERRAIICFRCHFNQPAAGCTNCSLAKLREAATEIVQTYGVAHDHALHICTLCGCSLQAKVRMPLELLQSHLSDYQNERLPQWCWLKNNDPATTHNPS